jgi:nicotinic acid mononucleotide adenylyltransferase
MSGKRERGIADNNGAAARVAIEREAERAAAILAEKKANASAFALSALQEDLRIKMDDNASIRTSLEALNAEIEIQEKRNGKIYKGIIYFGGSFAPITIAHEGAIVGLAELYPEHAILVVPTSNLYDKPSIYCANAYKINGEDFRIALVKKAVEVARSTEHTNVFFSRHEMDIPGGLLTGVSALSIKNILKKNVVIVLGKDNLPGLLERRFAHPRAILDLIKDGEFEFRYFERGGPLTDAEIRTALQKPTPADKSPFYAEDGVYRDPYTRDDCDVIVRKIQSLGKLKDGDAASEVGSVPVSSSAVRHAIYYANTMVSNLATLKEVLTTVLKGKIITNPVFDLMLTYQPAEGPFPYASGCLNSKDKLAPGDTAPDATVDALVDAALPPKVMVVNKGGGRRRKSKKAKKAKKSKKSRKTKKSSR